MNLVYNLKINNKDLNNVEISGLYSSKIKCYKAIEFFSKSKERDVELEIRYDDTMYNGSLIDIESNIIFYTFNIIPLRVF